MARSIILLATVALTLVSTSAWSLGLGTLLSKSALNQPFHGEIPLYDVKADELDTVKVRLASAEEFAKAGAPRSHFLTALQFQAKPNDNGQPIILVSSRDPVREPFLDFLVEVIWPQGRLVKEYTILLDPPRAGATPPPPPVAAPQVPAETPAAAPPVDTAPTSPVATAVAAPAPAAVAPAPAPAPVAAAPPVPAPAPVASPPPPTEVVDTQPEVQFPIRYGPIKPGAGLWRLANSITPDGATAAQTAMALYRCNPQAFSGGRINNLVVGRSLVIPSAAELFALDAATADREFKAALAGEPVRNTPLAPPGEVATAAVESKKNPAPSPAEPVAEAGVAPDKPVELTPPPAPVAPPAPPPVATNPPVTPAAPVAVEAPVDQPVAANPVPPPEAAAPVVPLSAATPVELSPPAAESTDLPPPPQSPVTAPPAQPLVADADTPEAAAMRQRIQELESRLNNIGGTLDAQPVAAPVATQPVVEPAVAPVTPKPKLTPPPPPPPVATSPLDMLAAVPLWALGAGGGLIAALLGFLIYRRSAAQRGDKPAKSPKPVAAKDKKPKRRSSLRTKEATSAAADSSLSLDDDLPNSANPTQAVAGNKATPEELDFNITLNLPPLDVPPGATAPVAPPVAAAVAVVKPAEVKSPAPVPLPPPRPEVVPLPTLAPAAVALVKPAEVKSPAPVPLPTPAPAPLPKVVPVPAPAAVVSTPAAPAPTPVPEVVPKVVLPPVAVVPVSPVSVAPAAPAELTGQQKTALLQADLFLSYGRYSEAQMVLQRAVDAMPTVAQLKYKLAEVYARTGDTTNLLQLIGTMMAAGDDRADPVAWAGVLNLLSQPAQSAPVPPAPIPVAAPPVTVAPAPVTPTPAAVVEALPVALHLPPTPAPLPSEAVPAPVAAEITPAAVPLAVAATAATAAAAAAVMMSAPADEVDEIVAAPAPAEITPPVSPPPTSHSEPDSSADITHTLAGFEFDPAEDWGESLEAAPVVEPLPVASKRMAALDIADLSPGAPEAAVSLPVEEWDKSIAAAAGLSGTDPFADLDALGESESTSGISGWNTTPALQSSEAFAADSRNALDLAADLEKLLAGDDSPPIASLRPSDVANDPPNFGEVLDNLDIDVLEDAVGLPDAAASSVADSIFQLPTPTEVAPPPPLPPLSTPATASPPTSVEPPPPLSTPAPVAPPPPSVEPPLPLNFSATPTSSGGRLTDSEPPFGPDSGASDVLSSQWQMDSGLWDEVATKMDLAFAYIEMDDPAAARVILEEVVREGNDEQRAEATALLVKLGN